MNIIQSLWKKYFAPHPSLPAGIYHYQTPADSPSKYRLHLRLEPDGSGILIVNASTVLHLNQTAAEYIYHFIQQTPLDEMIKAITIRYPIKSEQAREDYENLVDRLTALIQTPDLDPVTFLDFERREPYSSAFSAPYRLDCAVTYQQPEEGGAVFAPHERVRRELLTEEWHTILQKAWDAGIPHVIFTGGEPTMRPDLVELIAYAEKLGMVSGLLTNGLRLSEPVYLHQILYSGLDHLMLILDPLEDQSWEALRDVLAEDLYTTVHLTITPSLAGRATEFLNKVADLGAKSLSLSGSSPDVKEALQAARDTTAHLGLQLAWDLPVPYSRFHPVALELKEGEVEVEGAGSAWMYVEPDGDVLPAQGIQKVLGNLLTDPWDAIWKNR